MAETGAEKPRPKAKVEPKPKLTDKERHARFVAMAREVEAEETKEAFDSAFDQIIPGKKRDETGDQ
jgi:hypothetical protein